jgi:hypothetical protein
MANWTNTTKNTASWSDASRTPINGSFLLKEDTFYLLLETGDKIVLSYGVDWVNSIKH